MTGPKFDEIWPLLELFEDHGDEPTGMAVTHDIAERVDVDELAGGVVCLPIMDPAGLRTNVRTSYYHDDPNRYFGRDDADSEGPPRVRQVICERIYEDVRATADALVSLHTSWVATYPYTTCLYRTTMGVWWPVIPPYNKGDHWSVSWISPVIPY